MALFTPARRGVHRLGLTMERYDDLARRRRVSKHLCRCGTAGISWREWTSGGPIYEAEAEAEKERSRPRPCNEHTKAGVRHQGKDEAGWGVRNRKLAPCAKTGIASKVVQQSSEVVVIYVILDR